MQISHLVIKTQHDETRALRAIAGEVGNGTQYYIQFVPFDLDPKDPERNSTAYTVLPPAQKGGTMLSYPFSIKRGLYHVIIEKIISIDTNARPIKIERDLSSRFIYPESVMAGDLYTLEVKKEEAVCYGKKGARIRMLSREQNLTPRDVYYQIKGNTEGIKYYVPFKDDDRIDFFVKGVEPGYVDVFVSNPGFVIKYV